jgi:hypothetical protein
MRHDRRRSFGSLALVRFLSIAMMGTLAVIPTRAAAQCAFNGPHGSSGSTAYFVSSLVRAFVSCGNPGGNTPNATSVGGIPTCQPVETFHQQAGSPSGGWRFDNGSSYGVVKIKRTTGGDNAPFPPTLRDAVVYLKMYHIAQEGGGPGHFANGKGTVQMVFRITSDDYANGDMTYVDFPAGFGFTLNGGSVYMTKKLGDLMKDISQPRFPDCTSIEVVSVWVVDPNGNVFAVPGVKLQ